MWVPQRGWVWYVPRGQRPEGMKDPADLRGMTVLLNGCEVQVMGVEAYATMYGSSSRWDSFGLLV